MALLASAVMVIAKPSIPRNLQQEVEALASSLRSESLKAEVVWRASELTGADRVKSSDAVNFFHDLHAKHVLISALTARQHLEYDHKAEIAQALLDLVGPADDGMVQVLLKQLEHDMAPPSGGGEIQFPRARYRFETATILERITRAFDLDSILEEQRRQEEKTLGAVWAARVQRIQPKQLSEAATAKVAEAVIAWQEDSTKPNDN